MSDEEPSRVLHLRNVTAEVTHGDLQSVAAPFGQVQNVVLLREKNQALIQMDSVASATAVLNYYTTGYTEIGGRRVYLKYSRHSELTGKAAGQGNGSILLVSMSNPTYDIRTALQITADLLYQVFAPYGTVTKIVVVQKSTGENRQQALVQFDSRQTAEQAKQYLQGQNVYVGTSVFFTLDIQYSSLEDLTIRTSSATSRAFPTGPGATAAAQAAQQQQMLQQQLLQQQALQQQMLLQQGGGGLPYEQLAQLQQQMQQQGLPAQQYEQLAQLQQQMLLQQGGSGLPYEQLAQLQQQMALQQQQQQPGAPYDQFGQGGQSGGLGQLGSLGQPGQGHRPSPNQFAQLAELQQQQQLAQRGGQGQFGGAPPGMFPFPYGSDNAPRPDSPN